MVCSSQPSSISISSAEEEEEEESTMSYYSSSFSADDDNDSDVSFSTYCDCAVYTHDEAHLFAQKLNNSATMCIEIGRYGRAVRSLHKALKLAKDRDITTDASLGTRCPCPDCATIDGCIEYSENNKPTIVMVDDASGDNNANNNKSNNGSITDDDNDENSRDVAMQERDNNGEDKDEEEDAAATNTKTSVWHLKPIRVHEGHHMGSMLFQVVTFNLAIAHHLYAAKEKYNIINANDTTLEAEKTKSSIKKALFFYELIVNWQSKRTTASPTDNNDNNTSSSNTKFDRILQKNLCHIRHLKVLSQYSSKKSRTIPITNKPGHDGCDNLSNNNKKKKKSNAISTYPEKHKYPLPGTTTTRIEMATTTISKRVQSSMAA